MHQKAIFGLKRSIVIALIILLPVFSIAQTRRAAAFDIIIRGGTVYDGTGGPARRAISTESLIGGHLPTKR